MSFCTMTNTICWVKDNLIRKVVIVQWFRIGILRNGKARERYIPTSTKEDDSLSTLRGTILSSLEDPEMHLISIL